MKVVQLCPSLCDLMDYTVHGILQARILEWVAFPISRGIFQTQGSNPGLQHCRQILYQLSHKGSPRRLEWVACPFSRGFFWPRNQTRVSCIEGRFFTIWAIRLEPIKPEFSWHIPGEHLLLGFTQDHLCLHKLSVPEQNRNVASYSASNSNQHPFRH